jgi:RHH-type transcriptional regulator, proline utilization regulon repressor / proline dehydrogenase / delta 1-pyrroline-5-carboxylate dehydrogenase
MALARQTVEVEISRLLTEVRDRVLQTTEVCEYALRLAPLMLELCERHTRPKDREQVTMLSRLMNDKRGQVFTTLLTDRAYRSRSQKRTVEQARYLLRKTGGPSYVGALDNVGLRALSSLGSWLPTLTGTAMLNRIRHESSAFILPDDDGLDEYLAICRRAGVDVNVNRLGEEVLGEAEALRRVDGYIRLLERPFVDTMSVKASSIASQLDCLAFDQSVETLASRLEGIFRAAVKNPRLDGTPKLVVLDMEAFRDVELTLAAFEQVLMLPDLLHFHAGIALQTYLPSTLDDFDRLARFAYDRVQRGGAPIRVRLVKGANLAMERVESALNNWSVPILPDKSRVDSNFKRVLLRACGSGTATAVHVGVASHNLFDVCFGLVLQSSRDVETRMSFELLHGMAEPLQRALLSIGARVLVYAPVVGEHEFPSAIAYLVRRLDENTSADNYLRHSFGMVVGSPSFRDQVAHFRAACATIDTRETPRRRGLDREVDPPVVTSPEFANEADTDFAAASNRRWIERHLARQMAWADQGLGEVSSRIVHAPASNGDVIEGLDPSRPGIVPYKLMLASVSEVGTALAAGHAASGSVPSIEQRVAWLQAAAHGLRKHRGELIAAMVMDAGKRVVEADAEVSEAIDFAEYYCRSYQQLERDATNVDASLSPRGLTVITPPWNFPLAIPLGGVFAALVAGNPVILKPALETPFVALRACEVLWRAGVPLPWLQLVVCRDEVGAHLITDARTSTVVLTGSTETARKFLELRPELRLLAETGGKNALYVSDVSDHEQAVIDIVRSAFGHAGQKCSALSQVVLQRELYEDSAFLAMLEDAASSLKVGSAWDVDSIVTPLITPPSKLQREALTTLLPGESWLVQPTFDPHNERLVSPGIKLGVKVGSPAHVNEYFCPLLSVLCASDISDGLRIANATGYGLTAGLHSLDEREHDYFIDKMEAGNLYINRPITGAVVQRQPFGGWKASSFGPTAKAGGPGYVKLFCQPRHNDEDEMRNSDGSRVGTVPLPPHVDALITQLAQHTGPSVAAQLTKVAQAFLHSHTKYFAGPFDPSRIRGEDNWLRHRPVRKCIVWVNEGTSDRAVATVMIAAEVAECAISLFGLEGAVSKSLVEACKLTELQDIEQLASLPIDGVERVRSLGPCPSTLRELAHAHNLAIFEDPPCSLARFELSPFLREQAVSVRYHRYGHLGLRELVSGDSSAVR